MKGRPSICNITWNPNRDRKAKKNNDDDRGIRAGGGSVILDDIVRC